MEKLDYLRLDNLLLRIAKIKEKREKNNQKKNINREGFKDQNHFHCFFFLRNFSNKKYTHLLIEQQLLLQRRRLLVALAASALVDHWGRPAERVSVEVFIFHGL